jgi:iron complex outermembrane receptor protein
MQVGWGHFLSRPGVVENTWVKFREIVLAYNMPIKNSKVFRELNIAFTARDLFYIYTTLPDRINPEGILGAGDAQGFEWGALPGVRSFSLGLNVKF